MAGGLHHECFIEHQRGLLESGLEIAVRPLLGRLAHRQLAVAFGGEVGVRPLQRLDLRAGGRSVRVGPCRRRRIPDVSFEASVGAAGAKALDRIDDEGERFEVEVDSLDRFGGGQFVDRGDGENRFALVQRLVRQRTFGAAVRRRQIVGGQDCFDAGHGQRGAGVDVAHAGMRHGAEQQLGEQHAVRAIVLRIFRTSRDFGDKIWRRVVLPDQFLISHTPLPRSLFAPVSDGCLTPYVKRKNATRRGRTASNHCMQMGPQGPSSLDDSDSNRTQIACDCTRMAG